MFPAAVLLLTAVAPAAPADDFRRAEAALAADRFGEAEPLYLGLTRGDDAYLKRQSYERLFALYVRSGRPDRAVKLSEPYRAWLTAAGDREGLAALDLLLGECQLTLGYPDRADARLAAALAARPPLPLSRRLEALRLHAEVAAFGRAADEADRWAALNDAAARALADPVVLADVPLRVTATRYRAEALASRGDADAALAALAELPDLHDRLPDPLGRRDTQRLRAKLLAGRGRYAEAAPLFAEALLLQRRHQPAHRGAAGDVLTDWAAAAAAAGKHAEAVARRDAAAVEYKAALDGGDTGGALAVFAKLQALTRSARQFREALDVARSAADRWTGDPLVDGRLSADRGGLELLTSSYQSAQQSLARALADLEAADPPNLRALPQLLVNLATAELACDAPDRAEHLLTRCLALYAAHRLPDDVVRAECEYLRGAAAARRGDFAASMRAFRAGLAVCDRVGPAADPVRFNLALNTALIHKEQGDADRAGEALRDAAEVQARFASADDPAAALLDAVRADVAVAAGRVAEAAALVPRVEAACARQGLTGGYLWTTARHVRALERLAARDAAGAEAIWAELAAAQRADGSILLARTLNYLGVCAEVRGRDADARRRFEEARAFQAGRPAAPPVTRAITLWRLAVLADRAGEAGEAKRLLDEVFDIADRARVNTFGAAAQRAQFFAQFAPAFELLARWHARDGDGEGVLRVVARSRSRTLLDQTLAAGVDPRDRLPAAVKAPLVAREAAARAAVSKLRARAAVVPSDRADAPETRRLLADLADAQREYADAWREIINADPLTRVLTDPAFAEAALARVRREIAADGGALVAYMLGRDESLAVLCAPAGGPPEVFRLTVPRWAADGVGDAPAVVATAGVGLRGIAVKAVPQPARPVSRGGPHVPLTDAAAGRLVDHYLRQIADPGFNPTRGIAVTPKGAAGVAAVPGEVLGEAVLPAALRDRLRATGARRVVVIPDAGLHKLPFEALLLASDGSPRYALDELPSVCYAPSPGVLAVVTARPRPPTGPASLLTAADPAYPDGGAPAGPQVATRGVAGVLPRLPYTAVESETVRRFFPADRVTALLGSAASEPAVAAAIPGKRYVHLAAHGFADDAFGNLFAAVALTPPAAGTVTPEDDGFLTMNEIYRLDLSGCELTVLSACVTNVGPQRPLEAGVTLSGAFLAGGSRGVMASCWSVDDRATAELMGAFFARVDPAGSASAPPADALRAARLAVRGRPGWEAPFYWAPFVYVGPLR